MNKAIQIMVVVSTLCLHACSQRQAIVDVTKPQTLTLKCDATRKVHALEINGSGRIEGDATIALMLNGAPYKSETLRGNIDFKWNGDWYSDSAEIVYSPRSVTSGELTLTYEFHGL